MNLDIKFTVVLSTFPKNETQLLEQGSVIPIKNTTI